MSLTEALTNGLADSEAGARREQFSSAAAAQLAGRRLRQGAGGEQQDVTRAVPDLTAHPGGDIAADACARVVVGRVADFGEHRKALSIGVDTQRDHAAPSHAVDTLGRTLDIVRIEIPAGQHDEILRATADIESPLLVEVTQVSAVEPAICGQRHYTVGW